MSRSGLALPKLRRYSTPPSDDGPGDPERGEVEAFMGVPLLIQSHSFSTTEKPSIAQRLRTKKTLLIAATTAALLASPLICWVVLYFIEPSRDESCPIQQWKFPECSPHLLHQQGSDIPPLKTPEEWRELRRKYYESVQVSTMSSDWESLTKVRESDNAIVDNTGFLLPVEFKYSPGKGRGVYATKAITKGQQIWDSRFRGAFDSECATKTYFSKLSEEEQCRALFWGYNNNFYGKGFHYMTDFDGHNYMNHCSSDSSKRNTAHFFEGELTKSFSALPHIFTLGLGNGSLDQTTLAKRSYPGAHGMYAIRDIEEGEELCFDYAEIHVNSYFDYYTKIWTHSLKMADWWTL